MDPDRSVRLKSFSSLEDSSTSIGLVYSFLAIILLVGVHSFMARLLPAAQYSLYALFVTALFSFIVFSSSVYLVLVRFITLHSSRMQFEMVNFLVSSSLKYLFSIGLTFFLLVALLSFVYSWSVYVLIFAFVMWFSLLSPVFESSFVGLRALYYLGRLRLYESFFRGLFSLLFVLFGFGLIGALFGFGAGTLVALACSYGAFSRLQTRSSSPVSFSKLSRFAFPFVLVMLSYGILLHLDIFFSYVFFSDPSVFIASSIVAKVPVYGVFFSSLIFFPQILSRSFEGRSISYLVVSFLSWSSVICGVLTILFLLFGDTLTLALFGPSFAIGPLLGVYVFGFSCFALSLFLSLLLLAKNKVRFSFFLPLFVLALFLLFSIFVTSFEMFIFISVFVSVLLLAFLVYMAQDEFSFDYFL